MSKPRKGIKPPGNSGQTKTMFYNEGNPNAMLVVSKAGRRNRGRMIFPKAEAALAWCRQNGAILVYIPTRLEAN